MAPGWFGKRKKPTSPLPSDQTLMRQSLNRLRQAELLMQEAGSMEELDLGRAALLMAKAELQQLIRMAKRERGLELRSVAETEEAYQTMRELLRHHASTQVERSCMDSEAF